MNFLMYSSQEEKINITSDTLFLNFTDGKVHLS